MLLSLRSCDVAFDSEPTLLGLHECNVMLAMCEEVFGSVNRLELFGVFLFQKYFQMAECNYKRHNRCVPLLTNVWNLFKIKQTMQTSAKFLPTTYLPLFACPKSAPFYVLSALDFTQNLCLMGTFSEVEQTNISTCGTWKYVHVFVRFYIGEGGNTRCICNAQKTKGREKNESLCLVTAGMGY